MSSDPDKINGAKKKSYLCVSTQKFVQWTVYVMRVDVFYFSRHLQLIPLFFFIGGGTVMSMAYLARLALRNPDVW